MNNQDALQAEVAQLQHENTCLQVELAGKEHAESHLSALVDELRADKAELLSVLRLCEGNIASMHASHPKIWGIWLGVVRAAIAKHGGTISATTMRHGVKYRVTKDSTSRAFQAGDVVWLDAAGDICTPAAAGWMTAEHVEQATEGWAIVEIGEAP